MDECTATKLIESLFESWAPHLARYALRLTGSVESAEDLVQETFIVLYCKLREGMQIKHPRAFTAAVVRNLASVSARDIRRRSEVSTSPEDFDSMPWLPADAAATGADDIEAYMNVLSQREAEVLLLRIEARRYREIACQLGVSPKTVATLLARALRKLQAAVKEKVEIKTPVDAKHGRIVKTLQ